MVRPILILLILSTFGCATGLHIANPKGAINETYVKGGSVNEKMSAEKLKDKLTRSSGFGMGLYIAKAYPFTPAYIELSEQEAGKREMRSEAEIKKHIVTANSLYVDKRTCFAISVEANQGIESAKLENYVIKMKDSAGDLSDLSFNGTSVPNYVVTGYQYASTTWFNTGIACGKKVDLLKGVTLFVIPKFVPEHYKNEKIELEWYPENRLPSSIK